MFCQEPRRSFMPMKKRVSFVRRPAPPVVCGSPVCAAVSFCLAADKRFVALNSDEVQHYVGP